jgi:hypothetical protein
MRLALILVGVLLGMAIGQRHSQTMPWGDACTLSNVPLIAVEVR